MSAVANRKTASEGEFVALIALLISLVALSIDAMLPALPQMGAELGVAQENDRQFIVSFLFLGLAAGQLLFGPLSDAVGRKPAIYGGLAVFVLGSLISAFASDFTFMLIGRLLQGFGAAGPRIVVVAMVRDRFEGRAMARIMSLVMAVFILVPALAPFLGQGVLEIAHWRAIFGAFVLLAVVGLVWFAWRQPETLAPERRLAFTPRRLWSAVAETCRNRTAFGYTIAAGLIFGAFIGYLTSAQQIFQDLYGVGRLFPLCFAVLALALGGASLVNARLVMRLGMRALCRWSLLALTGISAAFFFFALAWGGVVPLWLMMAVFLLCFFCIGILFGNFNALAMEPLGHIAGVAAAVIGSITTLVSLVLGTAIGALYDGSLLPLVGGFAGLGLLSLLVMQWVERHSPESAAVSCPGA